MRVIGKSLLESLWRTHAQAHGPLKRWEDIVEGAVWCSFPDVKRTFGTADMYHKQGMRLVTFDVGGNKFRVTATIQFAQRNIQGTVVICKVEAHPEYDKRNRRRK